MERDQRRDDRRKREDTREHKPRYEKDRSRSPPTKERGDDRRRDRSPPRGPARGPPARSERDRDQTRGRDRQPSGTPPPSRRPGDNRPPPRQPLDNRSNITNTNINSRVSATPKQAATPEVRMQNGVEDEDSEGAMERMMGFKAFRTTKDTKVPGNERNYGVYKVKKTEYRQYMNRVGGFNRPLSPTRN